MEKREDEPEPDPVSATATPTFEDMSRPTLWHENAIVQRRIGMLAAAAAIYAAINIVDKLWQR